MLKMIRDDEKAEVFNGYSVFSSRDRPWASWSSELENHSCRSSVFHSVDTEVISDELYLLNVLKFVEPERIYLRVLK